MAMTKINRLPDLVLPFPEYVNCLSLTTAETLTVPADAGLMCIQVSALAYMNGLATATVPGDVTNGSGSFALNPNEKHYFLLAESDNTVPTISIIAATGTVIVTAAFYKN